MSTAGTRVNVNAQQFATFQVNTQVLAENLVTEEGSAMFSLVSVENTTVVRRNQLMFLTIRESVLPSDYTKFEASIQTLVNTKLIAQSSTGKRFSRRSLALYNLNYHLQYTMFKVHVHFSKFYCIVLHNFRNLCDYHCYSGGSSFSHGVNKQCRELMNKYIQIQVSFNLRMLLYKILVFL